MPGPKTVDIVSNTLWTGWFNDKDFRKEFFENLGQEPLHAF